MDNDQLYESNAPTVSGLEAELCDAVSREVPWEIVKRFAELERVSGSEEEQVAAEYLTDRLSELGVDHERYDPPLRISVPGETRVEIVEPVERDLASAKTLAFGADDSVTAEAVYAESPGGEPETLGEMLDVSLEATDQDIEGKVVVSETLLPINAIEDLQSAGAAGFIGIHPHDDEPHEGIITSNWGGIPDPGALPEEGFLVANVSNSEGQALIEAIETHDGVTVDVEAHTTKEWTECPMVLSRIEGEADPTEDFVLLHGHYDSWHVGVTDNATGDAGLLECARLFDAFSDELDRDLWVAWWPAHSTGRYAGSTWFVDAFAQELADHCVAHVNMDSPGVADATAFEDRVKWMRSVDDLCQSVISDVAGKDTQHNRPSRAGDYSFSNLGIPGLSLQSNIPKAERERRGYHPVGGSGGHANAWHLTTDTIDKADPDVLVRDIKVFAVALTRLLTAEVLPFDLNDTVEHHLDIVAEYDDQAGDRLDMTPVHDELAAISDVLDRIDPADSDPTDYNDALVTTTRTLTRLNFTSEGRFEQDPATTRPPYPSLEPATDLPNLNGDAFRCQQVDVYRARNRVEHDLRRARRRLETLV